MLKVTQNFQLLPPSKKSPSLPSPKSRKRLFFSLLKRPADVELIYIREIREGGLFEGFGEEPDAAFGFVEEDFEEAGSGYVADIIAHFMSLLDACGHDFVVVC